MALYPDLNLDLQKFYTHKTGIFCIAQLQLCCFLPFFSVQRQESNLGISAHRDFFNKLAEDMGFDPLNVDRWYKVTLRSVRTRKVFYLLLEDERMNLYI
jgi:hypothetical protein